jgi:hypothetical protein
MSAETAALPTYAKPNKPLSADVAMTSNVKSWQQLF